MKKPALPYIPIIVKLILGLLIIVILPLAVAAQYLYNASLDSLRREQTENSLRILEIARRNVEYQLEDLDYKQKNLYDNLSLMSLLPVDSERRLTDMELYLVRSYLREYLLRISNLNSVTLFLNNGQVISEYNGPVQFAEQYQEWFLSQEEIQPAAQYRDGRCIWLPTINLRYLSNAGTRENVQQSFSLGRLFRNAGSRLEDIGYIMQGMDVSLFDEPLGDLVLNNGQQMMITAPDGTVVWHSEQEYIAANIRDIHQFSHMEISGTQIETYEIGERSYLVTSTLSDYNGWQYSLLIPTEALMAGAQPIRTFSNIVWLVCGLVLLLGVVFYHRLVTRPLKKLIVDMNSLIPGKEPLRPGTRIHNDEIGVLYDSFVGMQKRINLLIKQVTDSHDLQIRQEMLALQAQLNPHFLYNTLDTVHWMADDIGAAEIGGMVESLAQIMRYIIGRSRGDATIADEINMVKNYMSIQQRRFENRFQLLCRADEEVLGCPIDRLLIQPIVENAVNHGFAQPRPNGLICLSVRRDGGSILVTVRDNGCGMTRDTIQDILAGRSDGIGLYNIHRYVRIKYGEEYGLSIQSTPGECTEVRLAFPAAGGGTANEGGTI